MKKASLVVRSPWLTANKANARTYLIVGDYNNVASKYIICLISDRPVIYGLHDLVSFYETMLSHFSLKHRHRFLD
jgi:hypothetical protein